TKGRIAFVLFEQDCPITTSRIARLVREGCYNGVKFGRVVKERLIQTDACTKKVKPIGIEVLDGLINTKGAVGMARTSDPNGATSQFYILLEPMRHLDYEYTVFGRLIDGMDVAFRIEQGDLIKTARVRNLTANDKRRFQKVLEIEAERKTE
ncbi:MAG: peptidylprolyl isomerase, partial [Armatimonadetes bacterium]|nr:peptidylprolyl isomerase [Armatimonadota bacterium]